MIRRDPTTQTAFGIGSMSSVLAFMGFTIDIVGIEMVAPHRNRDVIARDANTEMFTSFSRGTKNVVHSVCASVALSETSIHLEKRVCIKARVPNIPKPKARMPKAPKHKDVRFIGGLDEDSSDEDDKEDTLREEDTLHEEEEEEDEDGDSPAQDGIINVFGKQTKKSTALPLLLYKATNLVLMNTGLATRVWWAIDKMTPELVKYAERKNITTHRYFTVGADGVEIDFAPKCINCCGVLNDILLTIQDHSLKHPPDSAKGKLFNWTIELIVNPALASRLVPPETIAFGHSLMKITYRFGRARNE
jgi:hypothetical protein